MTVRTVVGLMGPLAFTLLALGGCVEDKGKELGSLLDAGSMNLLAQQTSEPTVIVAATIPGAVEDLGFAAPMRGLARAEDSFLIEVPASEAASLVLPGQTTRVAVWGPSSILGRMGPRLRPELLSAWGAESTEPRRVMVTFASVGDDLREQLTAAGAEVATVAGPVVTLSAPPDVLLTILRMPELASMNRPRELKPSDP